MPVTGPMAVAATGSSARDYLQLYRVRDWLHFLPLPLAGWVSGATRSVEALIGGVLGWALALAYMSAVNQAFDDRLDRALPGKNPVGGRFNRRQAVLLSLPPAVGSVAIVAWLSPSGLVPALLLLVAATVYSAPPRLKRIPVLGTLWNVVVGMPGLFFADSPDVTRLPLRLLMGLFALLLVVSQLIHEAEDRDDDRVGGVATVAVIAGMQGALAAASTCLLLLPLATFWLADGLTLRAPLSVGSVIFSAAWLPSLVSRIRSGDASALRRVRLGFRYASLAFGALVFLATTI